MHGQLLSARRRSKIALHVTVQGAGGFGEVFECIWRGQRVAVKKLPAFLEEGTGTTAAKMQYRALIAEIQLSCRFKCDRLVRITGRVKMCTARCVHFRVLKSP